MSKFKYLAGIIPFGFGIVFIITLIIGGIYYSKQRNDPATKVQPGWSFYFQRYFEGKTYEVVYRSHLRHWLGPSWSMYILLLWRVLSFAFFFGVAFIWNFIRKDGSNAHFFTYWNIDLITAYYFLTMIASLIGIANERLFEEHRLEKQVFWSDSLTRFLEKCQPLSYLSIIRY